jgi:hypothetical protein
MVKRSNKTFAVDRMGIDVQAISTSPYDMGYYKPVEFVNGVKSLTRAEKDAIIGGNAARLLGVTAKKR